MFTGTFGQTLLAGVVILLIILIARTVIGSWDSVLVDSRQWNVIGRYENKADAAALLSRVNARMIGFLRKLKTKYNIDAVDEPVGRALGHTSRSNRSNAHAMIDYLLDNYNPDVFYENDATDGETSYTISKGAAMYICLREPSDKNKLVNESDLFFVLLHESAHIANYRGWGHGTDFWSVFKFLLVEAEAAGVYTPVDYSKYPIKYCGLDVNYNPYFDAALPAVA